MNRNIKFRAWDNKTEQIFMVSGIMFDTGDVFSVEDLQTGYESGLSFDPPEVSAEYGRKMDEVDLMQFTGLKDKNGVDIYEGDIVRANKFYPHAVIAYHAPRFLIRQGNGVCDDFEPDEWGEFEVIGNVHENRDLLPSSEKIEGRQ